MKATNRWCAMNTENLDLLLLVLDWLFARYDIVYNWIIASFFKGLRALYKTNNDFHSTHYSNNRPVLSANQLTSFPFMIFWIMGELSTRSNVGAWGRQASYQVISDQESQTKGETDAGTLMINKNNRNLFKFWTLT